MTIKAKVDAIDRFVRTLKSGGLYDDIQAACVMAGWTNLAGALYPFKGSAPTNGGGLFQNADLDPGIGLKGDGSTKYLDANRAGNVDGQNDIHLSVYIAAASPKPYLVSNYSYLGALDATFYSRLNQGSDTSIAVSNVTGFVGASRQLASTISTRLQQTTYADTKASITPGTASFLAYRNTSGSSYSNATLSWYSIGSALDLAALDSAVSTLMADLRAIDEDGFEPESVNYLRAVEDADGAYLETGVKKAINRFIVGCKKDGIWDAIKSSCILCGARTIAGALVPLAGTAPTAVNFVSANYNRETGLVGVPASGTYIDTNRANDADGLNDIHLAVYKTSTGDDTAPWLIGSRDVSVPVSYILVGSGGFFNRSPAAILSVDTSGTTGLRATLRSSPSSASVYYNGALTAVSSTSTAIDTSINHFVFAYGSSTGAVGKSNARLAFYSVGSSLSLSALDARVTTLVSQIAAAIP